MNGADATFASEATDTRFLNIAETPTTAVSDPAMPQLADIAVRASNRDGIIAIIMQIGHLDRAHADELAQAIDIYRRTGIIDHGRVMGTPARSGALRLALAAVGRAASSADKVRPPPISTNRAVRWVRMGLLATVAWSVLLAWFAV